MLVQDESEAKLRRLAAEAGLTFIKCTEWHLQVRGVMLVNWYPSSKRRSAYIAGTTQGIDYCTAADVVCLAKGEQRASLLKKLPSNPKRRKPTGYHRRRLYAKHPYCHWCGKRVFMNEPCDVRLRATIDHVIPRSKGGLDHPNNYVLACHGCNHDRKDSLPQEKKQ